jgi:hypothetical protein
LDKLNFSKLHVAWFQGTEQVNDTATLTTNIAGLKACSARSLGYKAVYIGSVNKEVALCRNLEPTPDSKNPFPLVFPFSQHR